MSSRCKAILLTVVLVVGQLMTACGGRHGSSVPRSVLRATPVAAQVVLPTGATTTASALRVWSSAGQANHDAKGKVRVVVYNDGPQYAEARDAEGNLVVAGFVGRERTTLDAASTAEMLGYFAVGAYVVSGKEARMAVLNGLRGVTGFDAVAAAVAAQIASTGKVDPNEGTIGEIDLALSQAEHVLVAYDLAQSNQADVFDVVSTGGKVTINAEKPSLPADETTTLTAIVQNRPTDAVYRYEWRVDSGFRLNDAFGKTTDDLPTGVPTTSRESVAILAKDLKPGTATVRCKVTRIDGPKESVVDDGKGTVAFTGIVKLTPASAVVAQGGAVAFTASYSESTPVKWRYGLLPDTLGTLSTTGPTNAGTVTFNAGTKGGTATLTAEAFVDQNGTDVSVGKRTASVAIGVVDVPLAASFEFVELPGAHTIKVFLNVQKIDDAFDYRYGFSAKVPTYHWNPRVSVTFGPDLTTQSYGWSNTTGGSFGYPPPIVNGKWRIYLNEYYCSADPNPDDFARLKAIESAWGSVPIRASARRISH